jgi:hypothetical protein
MFYLLIIGCTGLCMAALSQSDLDLDVQLIGALFVGIGGGVLLALVIDVINLLVHLAVTQWWPAAARRALGNEGEASCERRRPARPRRLLS